MSKDELYDKLLSEIKMRVNFLKDKPEETAESTLKALWLAASGWFMSAEAAVEKELPDLNENEIKKLAELIEERVNNVPLAYITGRQRFMGVEMLADKRALIPRKETEILGRKALELSELITEKIKPALVIDTCCGAGNLGLALAGLNPHIKVFATDLSHEAVQLTVDNIQLLGLSDRVKAVQGDFLSAFENEDYYEKVDMIVCNPPYITSAKVKKMDDEISSNEPALAFDGGMLGIKLIQKLISESPRLLKKHGWVAFEIGIGQGPFVLKFMKKSDKFSNIGTASDVDGNVRVIFAQKA
jgi:release factor glutamine methyltransferase